MNNLVLNHHNRLIVAFHVPFVVLIWYQFYADSSAEQATFIIGSIFLVVFIAASYISNVLLPKAMHNKKMLPFIEKFIILTLLLAAYIILVLEISYILESKGVFHKSNIAFNNNDLFLEFLIVIPTPMMIIFTFCGFRFYYEHNVLERTHLETQLQVLKQQITPHFMFNVLNHIYILMQENVELASSLLLKYSDILRFQLYKGEQEYVFLEHDVQFLKDFIDIESIRWIDKIEVKCEWNIENGNMEIPPLLFITLIENAFKHVAKTSTETGFIDINFLQYESSIALIVENSKSKYQKTQPSQSGLGLKNMKKRFELLFAGKYKFEIEETEKTYKSKLFLEIE